MLDPLMVEKRNLAGMSLLAHDYADTEQLRLVGEHRDEASVRNEHEGLVGLPPQIDSLLPVGVVTDDKCADTMLHQQRNDGTAGVVQVVTHPAITLVGERLQPAAGVLALWELGLELRAALVVQLIQRLERSPVNQPRHKARQ